MFKPVILPYMCGSGKQKRWLLQAKAAEVPGCPCGTRELLPCGPDAHSVFLIFLLLGLNWSSWWLWLRKQLKDPTGNTSSNRSWLISAGQKKIHLISFIQFSDFSAIIKFQYLTEEDLWQMVIKQEKATSLFGNVVISAKWQIGSYNLD